MSAGLNFLIDQNSGKDAIALHLPQLDGATDLLADIAKSLSRIADSLERLESRKDLLKSDEFDEDTFPETQCRAAPQSPHPDRCPQNILEMVDPTRPQPPPFGAIIEPMLRMPPPTFGTDF